ncbi:MAG: hypothetical protein V1899_07720, partial [Planctomycetota bacterium]
MNEILTKLSQFVSSKDSRLACAAAVILSELAPQNSAVVRALVSGLEHGDPMRRPFIIEALGRIGTTESAVALVPLIKAEGPNSEQALRAIAHTAVAALKPLLQLLRTVQPALLERIAECIARTGEPAAFSGLLNHLANADVDGCHAVRNGLRAAMTSFNDKSKEHLRQQIEKAFHNKTLTQPFPALSALLKISGDLGDKVLVKYVVERIDRQYPLHVRRAALQAITSLHLSGEQRAKLATSLLPLLLDSDLANLAEPALEAVRQAHLGSDHQGLLRKLLNSPSSRIREFAMQAMAAHGSAHVLNELITYLDSPDRSMREDALSALSHVPSVAEPLAKRLLGQEGGELAWATVRALAPQAMNIPRRLLVALATKYVTLASGNEEKSVEPNETRQAEEKHRAILNVFRAANSDELVNAVHVQALKLRQKGEMLKAYELLKSVNGLSGWSDEHRLEMALAGLSIGTKDFSRAARNVDTNLQMLQEVFFSGHKTAAEMAQLILKDTMISRKLIYFLGFHFVERMNVERECGRMLLEHLSHIRSDEARLAREKLVIEGLAVIKGAKAAILEERARILLSASDLVAADQTRDKQKA